MIIVGGVPTRFAGCGMVVEAMTTILDYEMWFLKVMQALDLVVP